MNKQSNIIYIELLTEKFVPNKSWRVAAKVVFAVTADARENFFSTRTLTVGTRENLSALNLYS